MRGLAPVIALALLAACSSTPKKGGYYKDDGPEASPPGNLDRIADAKPRYEPLHRFANRPYEVFGKKYVPLSSVQPFHQRGVASWYGKKFHGQKTASGETYDMYAMTAAHPILPIPSYVRVTHLKSGKQVIVRINDRGPFHSGRVIDLSYAAAHRLGLIGSGSAAVTVDSIVPAARAGL
jgi:rare lipoprotein A